jgi:predicted transcriptional regulator
MAATSLKIPDDLKRRLEQLASQAQKTPHAFMLEVLAREAERAELRQRFAAEAADSERAVMEGGKTYALNGAFDYLGRRLSEATVRRPRARAWRGSK